MKDFKEVILSGQKIISHFNKVFPNYLEDFTYQMEAEKDPYDNNYSSFDKDFELPYKFIIKSNKLHKYINNEKFTQYLNFHYETLALDFYYEIPNSCRSLHGKLPILTKDSYRSYDKTLKVHPNYESHKADVILHPNQIDKFYQIIDNFILPSEEVNKLLPNLKDLILFRK